MIEQHIHIPAGDLERYWEPLRCALRAFNGPVDVTLRPHEEKRTTAQNRALFGHAYKIIRADTGHDVAELHTLFCGDYFGWVEYEIFGHRRKRPVRTTTTDETGRRKVLPKAEFSDFFSHVQRKAAEIGIFIPDPDPLWFIPHQEAA